MVTRGMTTQWRTYCFILGICGVLSTNPEFVAPVDPCRPQDVICPVTCNLMRMSGSTDCEFCFCKNPIDSVEWPDTTSTTTPTPSTTTTLPPGHSIVNNVHYVELKNPCVLSNAMCPLKCLRRNVTLDSGKVCERCECPGMHPRLDGQQSILVGKRTVSKESMITGIISTGEQAYLVRRNQNPGHAPPLMMHHEFWNRPCMPFFTCPILTCPAGQHLPVTPNGCRICQCVDNKDPDLPTTATTTPRPVLTTEATAPPTTIDPANFLEMFCLPKTDYCPSMCHVTNYRVGSWNCYHCTCPDGQTFVALQKPCNANSYNVCPSNCSIRSMEDSDDPTTSCQFCDCVKSSSVIYRKLPPSLRNNKEKESSTDTAVQRMRKFLMGPGHNSHVPYSGPMQAGNGFDFNHNIPAGLGFQAKTYEPSRPQPVQDHVTMAKTTVRTTPTENPENNCLTNADECPTDYCSLQTIGRQCNLCLCGETYFRDSDVGIFSILNTKTSTPSTSSPVTPVLTTPTVLTLPTTEVTMTPSAEASTNTALSTTATLTQKPFTAVIATPSPSIVIPVTHAPLTTAKVTTKATPTTCYACNETNCKSAELKTCAAGKDYCMNTIRQDRHGARDFSRECVGEESCYDKWWIHTMNNPVCLGMYNTEKGPANQPEVCHFCCKGPSCNSAARIEDYNLYTGDDHVIG